MLELSRDSLTVRMAPMLVKRSETFSHGHLTTRTFKAMCALSVFILTLVRQIVEERTAQRSGHCVSFICKEYVISQWLHCHELHLVLSLLVSLIVLLGSSSLVSFDSRDGLRFLVFEFVCAFF